MAVQILIGDVRERLRAMPAESVHCVVTSPPYWGLRDYGVAGQIGLEPTYQAHIAVMVGVFREVRRVLRRDGTLWLNYGDCYATTPNGRPAEEVAALGTDDRAFRDKPFSTVGGALKPKDAALMPHRLAIALQEDGWWVRSDIVWHKPNPMPSSTRDRPSTAKEYLFLLTKSPRYFYDAVAIREEASSGDADWKMPDGWDTGEGGHGSIHRHGREKGRPASRKPRIGGPRHADHQHTNHLNLRGVPRGLGRNKRDVWTIATEPFSDAHFATMPTRLVEPCILAGTSERGVCPTCGAPWVRLVDREFVPQPDVSADHATRQAEGLDPSSRWAGTQRGTVTNTTTGWAPSCGHDAGPPVPATVLDPFGGAGTVGLVADRLRRFAILIELNPQYAALAARRIAGDASLLSEVTLSPAA